QNLILQSQYEEAESLALQLLERQNHFAPIYDVLYFHYVSQGQADKAYALLRQKIANNPGEPRYLMQLCQDLHRQKKPSEVAECLGRLAAGSDGALLTGDFYSEIGDWEKAIREYQRGAAEKPDGVDRYRNRIAAALISQGKRDEALAMLDAILRDHPGSGEARASRPYLPLPSRAAA